MIAIPFLTKPETQARIHKYLKRGLAILDEWPRVAAQEERLRLLEEWREQMLMIGGLLLRAHVEEEAEYIRTHPKRKTVAKERLV